MNCRYSMRLIAVLVMSSTATAHEPGGHTHQPSNRADLQIMENRVNPWTHLEFINDPRNFQFLIVSDRTGGHREGIFPEALRKAELLQPEFIMSVGDLIEGYTDDPVVIEQQWDEFQNFLDGFRIPFFYLPGNHDMSNRTMASIWERRFGAAYYHFVYRDVLFLCINSEDGRMSNISDAQVAYFRNVLQEHQDVRWTLVFMHKPLWDYRDGQTPNWPNLEALLEGRDYTVFAGHYHTYTKHIRKDRRYIVLATTGGGSSLKGPDAGQFDHVMWVTMTDQGPILANLMLDGIWDDNIFTTRTARLKRQLTHIQATPLILGRPGNYIISPAGFRLTNDEDTPMYVHAMLTKHALVDDGFHVSTTIPPNSIKDFEIPCRLSDTGLLPPTPLELRLTARFEPTDHRPMQLESTINLAVEQVRTIPKHRTQVVMDGSVNDWRNLRYGTYYRTQDGKSIRVVSSQQDGRGDFAIRHDEENLYVGVRVWDDRFIPRDSNVKRWHHDFIEIRIDARPFAHRTRFTRQWDNNTAIYICCMPTNEAGRVRVWRRRDYPRSMQVLYQPTPAGYDMELAIPLEYIRMRGGVQQLERFTLNVTVVDRDDPEADETRTSWQPDWHHEDAVIGAGAFGL